MIDIDDIARCVSSVEAGADVVAGSTQNERHAVSVLELAGRGDDFRQLDLDAAQPPKGIGDDQGFRVELSFILEVL